MSINILIYYECLYELIYDHIYEHLYEHSYEHNYEHFNEYTYDDARAVDPPREERRCHRHTVRNGVRQKCS